MRNQHTRNPHLLLIGCGHMGRAMLRGWRRNSLALNVVVADPKYQGEELHTSSHSVLPLDFQADIVVLAVPPQIAEVVIDGLSPRLHDNTLVISIMAGKSISWLSAHLDQHPLLVRVMPNLPAAIGKGVCGYYTPAKLEDDQQKMLNALLQSVGTAIAVETEDQINMVTAVSGSGPAYVFLLIDAMMQAGIRIGLPKDIARTLAIHTVSGAGEYASGSEYEASELLSHIAVKGGTTEAALSVLTEDNAVQQLFDQAVAAAADRARELAN